MILEVATLNIIPGKESEFEAVFSEAQEIIASIDGYISHQLHKCIEKNNQYILMVNWETLEDHTVGFRESERYQQWRKLLHHFYDPFPVVEHYHYINK
jgi:heme-degrading monooxygenase HmoA